VVVDGPPGMIFFYWPELRDMWPHPKEREATDAAVRAFYAWYLRDIEALTEAYLRYQALSDEEWLAGIKRRISPPR
jgi:hypothetical protein